MDILRPLVQKIDVFQSLLQDEMTLDPDLEQYISTFVVVALLFIGFFIAQAVGLALLVCECLFALRPPNDDKQ
jgi:hypothetical protein